MAKQQNIPQEIKQLNQWVNWQPVKRGGKITKPPINPHTGRYAEVDDPGTWGSFSLCSSKSANVGLALTADDGLVAPDLDDCVDETGKVDPVVWRWVKKLDTYTEYSPSGRGLRLIGYGHIGRNYGAKPWEIYEREHYVTFTGRHVPGTPTTINDIQRPLDEFIAWLNRSKVKEEKRRAQEGGSALTFSDNEIIQRGLSDPVLSALFDGTHDLATSDPSRADWHLATKLAFYSDDPAQIDRIMRASRLKRDKYDRTFSSASKVTYLDRTISKVLSSNPNKYTGAAPQTVTTTTQLLDHPPDKSPGELAGEIFGGDPVMVLPSLKLPMMRILHQVDDQGDGVGEWPKPPKKKARENKAIGTVITIIPMGDRFSGKLADRHDRKWKLCPREYHFRVMREAKKALAEQVNKPMYYLAGLDGVDVDRLLNRWRMRSKRSGVKVSYQVYPQDGGDYVIVTDQDESSKGEVTISEKGRIADDRTDAFIQFAGWLDTPEFKKLNRHSQGYGLRFEGSAGDGRVKYLARELVAAGEHEAALNLVENVKKLRKSLQLVTDMKRDFLADQISNAGYEVLKGRFWFDDLGKFANTIKKVCPDLKTRSGETAWFALDALCCTQVEHTEKQEKTVCVSRVQEASPSVFSPSPSPAVWQSPAEIAAEIPF